MNNKELLEATIVGTAGLLFRTILVTLKAFGMLMIVMLGYLVSLIFVVTRRK